MRMVATAWHYTSLNDAVKIIASGKLQLRTRGVLWFSLRQHWGGTEMEQVYAELAGQVTLPRSGVGVGRVRFGIPAKHLLSVSKIAERPRVPDGVRNTLRLLSQRPDVQAEWFGRLRGISLKEIKVEWYRGGATGRWEPFVLTWESKEVRKECARGHVPAPFLEKLRHLMEEPTTRAGASPSMA